METQKSTSSDSVARVVYPTWINLAELIVWMSEQVPGIVRPYPRYIYNCPTIILLSGKMLAGKDTVGAIITEMLPGFQQRAFAAKLKKVVSTLCNVPEVPTREEKEQLRMHGRSLGTMLQDTGAKLREISPNIFVDALFEDPTLPEFVIVTDCRHKEEVERGEALGGVCIRINGDPLGQRNAQSQTRNLNHLSETALDDHLFKYVIDNNGTLDELRTKVRHVLTNIYGENYDTLKAHMLLQKM